MLAAGGGGGAGNLAFGGDGGQSGGSGGTNGLPGGTGATVTGPGTGSVGGQDGLGPTDTTAIQGSGGTGANASGGARSGGGGGGGYYGGGGGASEGANDGAVSGGGGGSDYVGYSATAVLYEDGAGGPGGEDNTDHGQAGELEILYSVAQPTPSVPSTAGLAPGVPSTAEPEPARPLPAHPGTPVSHLIVYTHGGQGVIDTHALIIKASCGQIACSVRVSATLEVPGLGRLPILVSRPTAIAASQVGRASVPVPKALRHRLRRYLMHHRRAQIEIQLTVTAATGVSGSAPETFSEMLPTWTLPGLH
jgi:hypothetical protein